MNNFLLPAFFKVLRNILHQLLRTKKIHPGNSFRIGNKSVTFQMFLKNAVQAFVIHFWYVGGGVINHVSDT